MGFTLQEAQEPQLQPPKMVLGDGSGRWFWEAWDPIAQLSPDAATAPILDTNDQTRKGSVTTSCHSKASSKTNL